MSIFSKKLGKSTEPVGLGILVAQARKMLDDTGRGGQAAQAARGALATESISSAETEALSTVLSGYTAAVESIAQQNTAKGKFKYTKAQLDAAAAAAVLVGDMEGYAQVKPVMSLPTGENISVVGFASHHDAFDKRSFAAEAYDEKENRKAAQYTVAYNMNASRQDEFGEAFFPTVTITPDNLGFEVQARIVSVFNDFHRSITGDVKDYGKRNLIRAAVDHTILQNDLTRIIPVNRTESVAHFVAAAKIPVSQLLLGNETIPTSPLLFGNRFSLIDIGQTDSILVNGAMEVTDAIDPGMYLENVYVTIGADDLLAFNVKNLPLAAFAPAQQGNYRLMQINFTTDNLLVNKFTLQSDGSALVALASVVTGDLILQLSLNVSGTVNCETGETVLNAFGLSIASLQTNQGVKIASTDSRYTTIQTALNAATTKAEGYDLLAYRTNTNRRQRGQLLDTTYYRQLYPVALRSPITVLRPVTTDGQNDAADLAALISATQIRASNEAVTTLLEGMAVLSQFVDNRASVTLGVAPDILGAGRLLVVPAYRTLSLDMTQVVDSVSSHQRAADIQAALVSAIRDMAYGLYRDSAYQPAANALAGGQAAQPTVIVGTDPVIARYLMVDGDFRTLGAEFEVKLVSTNDLRVKGNIFISFGQFDGSSENAPNPLHFGNMAWKPEMTLVLPISRGGQVSKELTVQPSFRHVLNLPVAGVISISNISDTVNGKVAIDFHSVP